MHIFGHHSDFNDNDFFIELALFVKVLLNVRIVLVDKFAVSCVLLDSEIDIAQDCGDWHRCVAFDGLGYCLKELHS
jgi:hypothetical protein